MPELKDFIRLSGNAIIAGLMILVIIVLIFVTIADAGHAVVAMLLIVVISLNMYKIVSSCEDKNTTELLSLLALATVSILYTSRNLSPWIFGLCLAILAIYNGYRWQRVRNQFAMNFAMSAVGTVMGQGYEEGGAFSMPNVAGMLAKAKRAKEMASTSYQKVVDLSKTIQELSSVQNQVTDPAVKNALAKLFTYNSGLADIINLMDMIRTMTP
jgi:hypothetical protein